MSHWITEATNPTSKNPLLLNDLLKTYMYSYYKVLVLESGIFASIMFTLKLAFLFHNHKIL